jgi:SAM-dependent methyltransferase
MRVGMVTGEDQYAGYERLGRQRRAEILALLPEGWSFEQKRVLDFGCGAGRVLRHFLEEAQSGEFYGCDIDGPSVEWLNANLSPFRAVQNAELPPLPWPDRSFDLIWALSVFTHLTDHWSAWLLELHRLLDTDGLLIATFLGEGMSETIAGEPWEEDRIGMNVLRQSLSWDKGGPTVLHSPWWIREHWGRIFAVEALEPLGYMLHERGSRGHGAVMLRKEEVTLTPTDLERIRIEEPREIRALQHNIQQLHREAANARSVGYHLERIVDAYRKSRSWKLTRPVRAVGALLRRTGKPAV